MFFQFMVLSYRTSDPEINRQSVPRRYHNRDVAMCEEARTMNAIEDRVRGRRKELRLSQVELSRRAGLSQTTIADIERGRNRKSRYLLQLAEALECSPEWLESGVGTMGRELASNISAGPVLRGRVPVISWVQAGHAAEAIDLLQPGEGYDWIETDIPIHRHTFALRVNGDSMDPEFPAGTIVIVEPEMEPNTGDYVIAKNGDGEATLKMLMKDGPDWYLVPLNNRYPIKPLSGYQIVGTVRGKTKRFR